MRKCGVCGMFYPDSANFCGECGRPLQPLLCTPLTGDITLGSRFMDGMVKLPDGRTARAGGNSSLCYDHAKRLVRCHEAFYGPSSRKDVDEELPIPPSVTSKEELIAYVRKQRPGWEHLIED